MTKYINSTFKRVNLKFYKINILNSQIFIQIGFINSKQVMAEASIGLLSLILAFL